MMGFSGCAGIDNHLTVNRFVLRAVDDDSCEIRRLNALDQASQLIHRMLLLCGMRIHFIYCMLVVAKERLYRR